MRPGSVIMQIGNKQLDGIYEQVIAPAMRACDVEPRRVDKHNEGRLLSAEIARLIREADIIVADARGHVKVRAGGHKESAPCACL